MLCPRNHDRRRCTLRSNTSQHTCPPRNSLRLRYMHGHTIRSQSGCLQYRCTPHGTAPVSNCTRTVLQRTSDPSHKGSHMCHNGWRRWPCRHTTPRTWSGRWRMLTGTIHWSTRARYRTHARTTRSSWDPTIPSDNRNHTPSAPSDIAEEEGERSRPEHCRSDLPDSLRWSRRRAPCPSNPLRRSPRRKPQKAPAPKGGSRSQLRRFDRRQGNDRDRQVERVRDHERVGVRLRSETGRGRRKKEECELDSSFSLSRGQIALPDTQGWLSLSRSRGFQSFNVV